MKMLIVLLIIGSTNTAWASIPTAYRQVAMDHGIPPAVFYSIMLIESGKTKNNQHRPWPWTLNVELKPMYFDSRAEAEASLAVHLADPSKRRIAVGLGQIYLPSHGKYFPNPVRLLDPGVNLKYAAELLAAEYQWTINKKKPSWWVAVGRYHTPSRKDLSVPYARLVYKRCKTLSAECHQFGVLP